MGGVLTPSILNLFIRVAGSCEKIQVSPARQLPASQYLQTPISMDSKLEKKLNELTGKYDRSDHD